MTLKKLVIPVFSAVFFSTVAFTLLVAFMIHKEDTLALQEEKTILKHELRKFNRWLNIIAENYGRSDTALENMMVTENIPWVHNTLAANIFKDNPAEAFIALRPDGSVLYSLFQDNYPDINTITASNLFSIINTPRPEQMLGGSTKGDGFYLINNRIFGYAFFEISTDESKVFSPPLQKGPRPILIFLQELNAKKIKEFSAGDAIQNLKITKIPNNTDALIPILSNGIPIAYLEWDAFTPGTHIASFLALPSIALAIILVISLVFFTRSATSLINELERANKSKSAFLASMSHEVRTPLNSIIGFTELIALELYGKIEGEKNKEYLSLIKGSGKHLLSIINDILDISKLEAGKYDVLSETIFPDKLVRSCLKLVEPSALDKSITMTLSCPPTIIESDERIFRQVLLNILSNAIKFTPIGGTIHIYGKLKDENFQLKIIDNGIGMSPDNLKKALDLFGQVTNKEDGNQQGTGLGLPLVSRFMTLLDGSLRIESDENKGTTVILIFPLKTIEKHFE